MSLRQYRAKRRFSETPEPSGAAEVASDGLPRFVVQKHDARRLHFDFRLEIDGVLKSWAVPRGPSLYPSRRRLAVRTEDHPLDYADFEGLIPAGQYGGGPVIVWDRGTWECTGSASAALEQGKLKIQLTGERLRGGWTLVRTGKGAGDEWLLIKERDAAASGPHEPDLVDTQQTSVVSGRTLQQVRDSSPARSGAKRRKSNPPTALPAATLQDLPAPLAPKLPRLVDRPPRGDRWVHELKLDGYRMQARLAGGQVQLLTRNHQDWTGRLPAISDALAALPAEQAIFDGELVAVDAEGATDFAALQSAFREGRTDALVLYLFDLLYLNGTTLLDQPLLERKALLEPVVRGAAIPRIQYLDHLEGDGRELLDRCRARGLEGIVSKRRDRGYQSGRADDWLKCKCRYRERFVVGGFTSSDAVAGNLGALLVGYYHPSGDLIYAGRVGAGWSGREAETLRHQLEQGLRRTSPFARHSLASPSGDEAGEVSWVQPSVVVEVTFSSWTRENRLRHASLAHSTADTPARSVVRESLTVDHPPGDPNPKAAVKPTSALEPTADSIEGDVVQKSPPRRSHPQLRAALSQTRLTSPERVLYSAAGYTKMDLVSYFTQASAWILPHIQDRPISIVRCPRGIEDECFFQKHAKPGTPTGLKSVRIAADEEAYLMVDDLPGLLAAVQMNAVELHPWGSRRDRPERPDRLIFDLDPDLTVSWEEVIAAAWQLRERLDELGLASFVKTTGGKGLHVTVPLTRRHEWERVTEFAARFVKHLAAEFPKRYTANMAKRARLNRIFIDYHRNRQGATAIAPYSPRARAGATVATPLDWNELTPEGTPDSWTIETVPGRLRKLKEDPWAELGTLRQWLRKDL